ncbi:MAG: GGDEF domain-containing protein [Synergistaceae bacterium]|nr:GGDEF domain-containing protein [Synergistaceae bacterium]
MSLAYAFSRVWRETSAAFAGSGYSLFTIEANIVCIIILAILFNRQQNSSDQTESGIILARLLFVQILYCFTGILRDLADVGIIPQSNVSQYIITVLNLALFGAMCWLVFLYMERLQKTGFLDSPMHRVFAALPFAIHIVMLLVSSFSSCFIDLSGPRMKPGAFFPLMIVVNLVYPFTSAAVTLIRRNRMSRYEREAVPATALYPVLFTLFTPIQALNWRMPLLCYVIVISDLLVYVSHADSLVLVDPLTKIPNRNGLMRSLSERLGKGEAQTLHVFAVDIDDMSVINSSLGRIEGDRALIIVAGALRKFQKEEHECYISRYYGDEFILTSDIQDEEERDLFMEHIRNYVNNAATVSRLPYHLRVSVGWSKYEQFSRTESISGLIEEADRVLTENKERKRFSNMWHGTESTE